MEQMMRLWLWKKFVIHTFILLWLISWFWRDWVNLIRRALKF